jgi:hypothetical protein
MFVATWRREGFFGDRYRLYIERPPGVTLQLGKCWSESQITVLQPFFCPDQAVRIQKQQTR